MRSAHGAIAVGCSCATRSSPSKAGPILDLYAGVWQDEPLTPEDCVLSADEKTSVQARRRLHVPGPCGPHRVAKIEHEYERMGAWAYLAAWDVQRAKLFGRCEPANGLAPFDRLVAQVMAEEPYRSARRVFWIVDNGSGHRGPTAVERLQRQWPNVIPSSHPGERGEHRLTDQIRYFFYLTNDRVTAAAEVVFLANDRCNQENLIDQRKHGVGATRMPVDTLLRNGADMVMAAFAWTLKAWLAWRLPETGRWATRYTAEKATVVRMECKAFRQAFMLIPVHVVRTSRRLVFRLLAWNPWQAVFVRGFDQPRDSRSHAVGRARAKATLIDRYPDASVRFPMFSDWRA